MALCESGMHQGAVEHQGAVKHQGAKTAEAAEAEEAEAEEEAGPTWFLLYSQRNLAYIPNT